MHTERDDLNVQCARRSLYPSKRTLIGRAEKSALCQKRTLLSLKQEEMRAGLHQKFVGLASSPSRQGPYQPIPHQAAGPHATDRHGQRRVRHTFGSLAFNSRPLKDSTLGANQAAYVPNRSDEVLIA